MSVHIKIGTEEVLVDLGSKNGFLLHNLPALNLKIDDISRVVLSHAHSDHTGGLNAFLKARTKPIHIIAHPFVFEEKTSNTMGHQGNIGLPPITQDCAEKMRLQLSAKPVQVLPNLYTIGEVPLSERLEKQGVAEVLHRVGDSYCWDPVLDDLSLVLNARDGLVLITGCCHAGLLNVCQKAAGLFNRKILAIIGGTHMAEYTSADVEHVAATLKDLYGVPQLYLCHCTGEAAICQLKQKFGAAKVHEFIVGQELSFEV